MIAEADGRLWVLIAAIVIDAGVGEPRALWRLVPHPVVAMGAGIGWLDDKLNREQARTDARSAAGGLAAALILGAGLLAGGIASVGVGVLPYAGVFEAIAVAVILAGRGLYDHVAAIADGLAGGGVKGGRAAVAHIVGRDPHSLDEPGVVLAGIESLAENFSDGVIAPALWYLVFGLPGLVAYKAVNTADSMIGHRTPRHLAFGAATARLDDVLNWIPARLSGGLIAIAAFFGGWDWRGAIAAMRADAGRHRSVNAGWPEAAMAGALGVALAGPRSYDGKTVDDALMNAGGRLAAGVEDIRAALRLFIGAAGVFVLALALIATVN
ncbi:Adenosylcobinamide-phosphate synthase [hydrothermal vent metagenome]|uniref:Adenosylcobinamide-phosphate synthase n=1 Tax=hydrothermal vent metagenome TaxID=652676 RepID=A0A3B0T5F6_9ZZZZ